MKILVLAAVLAVAVAGCDQRVIVEDDHGLRTARVNIPHETHGKFSGLVRTETPTTTVVTITFTKTKEEK